MLIGSWLESEIEEGREKKKFGSVAPIEADDIGVCTIHVRVRPTLLSDRFHVFVITIKIVCHAHYTLSPNIFAFCSHVY